MTSFWLNEVEYRAATAWTDCTGEQIANGLAIQLAAQAESNPQKRAHWQIGMLMTLTNAPANLVQKLTGAQLQTLLGLVRWAFSDRLDHRPFESFEHLGRTYFLFRDQMADVSAIEMAMANIYYLQFSTAKKDAGPALARMVATLCRPQRTDLDAFRDSVQWNGDVREIYNSIRIDERGKEIESLPIGYQMAVLMYFEAQNTAFLKKYGEVFGEDDDQKPLYQNGEGWIAMLSKVAELGTHGPFEQVCSTNCHTVWLYLKHRAAENARQEEELERERARLKNE